MSPKLSSLEHADSSEMALTRSACRRAEKKKNGQEERHTYVVLRGATDAARLALYTLPLVRPHRLHHVVGELQARGVTCRVEETRQGRDGGMDGRVDNIICKSCHSSVSIFFLFLGADGWDGGGEGSPAYADQCANGGAPE